MEVLRMKMGLFFMVMGMIVMLIGAGTNALPELSTVSFSGEGATIEGLNDLSASFIFVGVVITFFGFLLYLRRR
jgi:hypothetical protein